MTTLGFLSKNRKAAVESVEIRLHGRGGQGAVSAGEMLVAALAYEGKFAAGFPFFGSERRGAPTTAYVRFGGRKIREKTKVYNPDCLLVFDPSQLDHPQIYSGLKPSSVLVANGTGSLERRPHENIAVAGIIDATPIAMEELHMPAISTCMLGAFAGTTGWISLESIIAILPEYFSGKLLEDNRTCVQRGFREVRVIRF